MEPTEPTPEANGHRSLDGAGLDRVLDELRRPLSVIYASTQLLQRRIGAGKVSGTRELLERLAVIERSAWTIELRLRELERHVRYRL